MSNTQKIVKAKWWIIDNEKLKIQGHLNIVSENDIKLELDGIFNHDLGGHFTIIGVTDSNRYFTLYNCYHVNSKFTIGENKSASSTFKVRSVFEGKLEFSDSEPTFKTISIKLEHGNLFGKKSQYDIMYSKAASIRLETIPAKTTEIIINDECTLKIIPWSNIPIVNTINFKEFIIKQDCIFKFEFKSLLPFDIIVSKYIRHFDHFLMLALRRVNKIKEINYHDVYNNIYKLDGVLYETGKLRDYNAWEIYFDADYCGDSLERYLQNWFSKANIIEHAINSYFSQLRDNGYVEDHFLGLARALEVFDRFVNETIGMKKEEIERIRSLIQNSNYDDADKKFIQDKLNFSHEPTFKHRLRVLLDKFVDILNDYIDNDIFIKNVGNFRNYYTHYSLNLERKVKNLAPLSLANQMALLLDVCFLHIIGFSLDNIKEMINNRSDSNFLKSLRDE